MFTNKHYTVPKIERSYAKIEKESDSLHFAYMYLDYKFTYMQQIYKTTGSLSVDEKNIMRFVIEKMKMLQDKLLQKYGPQGDIDEYLHDKIDLEKYLLVKYIGVSSIQGNIERMQSFLQSTYK